MTRNQVFISYSHHDDKWLKRVRVHLRPLERAGLVISWDDTKIKPGVLWRQEIQTALDTAKVAILLVSADFVACDFISEVELPSLLLAAKQKGAVLLSVIINPCLFSDIPELSQFQCVNSPSRPITGMTETEQEATFVKLATSAKQAMETPLAVAAPEKLPTLPERNPLFTGREDILAQIEQALRNGGRAALSGMGGAGKTQTAIEYAHRHASEYPDIFYVSAATRESLISDYASIAVALNLPESSAKEQEQAINAVKRTLASRQNWVLILDNADDIEIVRPLIPDRNGHVLLTTRAHALGATAKCIDIREMNVEEASELLLRRAKIESPTDTDRKAAREIATNLLDGLPLALDQAGAYIEETGCGLTAYIDLYKKHAPELLKRRGVTSNAHPDPVATTWSLSFEKIEKANSTAADLLRLCAFLAPDAIPEEILVEDALGFNDATAEILKYSLLTRDPTNKTLEIHRLVQDALKQGMTSEQRHSWAERAVRAVDEVLPNPQEFRDWPACERLLPQALICAELVAEHNLGFSEAARLLNAAGYYLGKRARYAEATPHCRRALAIDETAFGPDHPRVATDLNNLAGLYAEQGEYDKAEPLYERSLAIREKTLGPDHPAVAITLNNLAECYLEEHRYDEAEPLYQRSLKIQEQARRPDDHPDLATVLNNLATLYDDQGNYDKAEPLYQRSLAIRHKALTPNHPDIACSLNNLGVLYFRRGDYAKAEPLWQRALSIWQNALGPHHPNVATALENYAHLLDATDRAQEAAELRARAAAIPVKKEAP